jgi:hypothetical protein
VESGYGQSATEPKVTVVGDHDRCVDLFGEDIHEQMRRDVDIGTFLLALRNGRHERGAYHWIPERVLDHDRPISLDDLRYSGRSRPANGERRLLDPRNVVSQFYAIHGSCAGQGLDIYVLVGITGRIGGCVYQRRAVRDPHDARGRPVDTVRYKRRGQRPDIQPSPS